MSTLQYNLDDVRTAMRMLEAGPRDRADRSRSDVTGHDDHDGMTLTGPDRTEPAAGGSFLRRLLRRNK